MKLIELNLKTILLSISILAIASCGSDSDGDGDGDGGGNTDEFAAELIGLWLQEECEYNYNDGDDYYSKTTFEFTDAGEINNGGTEYTDENCFSVRSTEDMPDGKWGPNPMTYVLQGDFDEGVGGSSGYKIDISFTEGEGEEEEEKTIYTIISTPHETDGTHPQTYFWLGHEAGELDASSDDARPDSFDNDTLGYVLQP